MLEKTINEFLSNEYRDFALYTIENRAIPSVIDGFKPVQRKIIHISSQIWRNGNEKGLKVFQLSGKVSSDSFYHHGSASMDNAIVNMAQRFKNNTPLLEEDGQFGTLRSPEAGAPRYIGTKLSPYFNLIYKDKELLEYKKEEGELIEPKYFLPIIPMVLVNGSSGISVGFSSNILNRDIFDVIKSCEDVIKNKKIKDQPPKISTFNGDFLQDSDNSKRWIIRGKFVKVNTTTIRVIELPVSMTYEKYEQILDKLLEDGKITSYDNNCKDSIDYIVKFKRADLEKLNDEALIKFLKLEEYSTEIFNVLDEFGKLKQMNSYSDIVEYFVNFRLKYYQKRKDYLISDMEKQIHLLVNRARFIKLIIDKKLEIRNKPKLEIISKLEEFKLDKLEDSYDYLLRMQIWNLTKEVYEKLLKEISDKTEGIKNLKEKEIKNMFLEDLKVLKTYLIKIKNKDV